MRLVIVIDRYDIVTPKISNILSKFRFGPLSNPSHQRQNGFGLRRTNVFGGRLHGRRWKGGPARSDLRHGHEGGEHFCLDFVDSFKFEFPPFYLRQQR